MSETAGTVLLQFAAPSQYDESPFSWLMGSPPRRVSPPLDSRSPAAADVPLSPETTVELVAAAKAGDARATDRLFARCLPVLRRWARGRLPTYARDLLDTDDLVQETIFHALRRLGAFEPRHEGALQAYLRQAVANRIRDEVRRVTRRPAIVAVSEDQADGAASPLQQAIGREDVDRYEAALQRVRPADREAIVARMELQYSYEALAVALAKPSANAARVAVKRALARLVEVMAHEG
jgi:RNA polymerase sigma-70 factor, ECF subfamily